MNKVINFVKKNKKNYRFIIELSLTDAPFDMDIFKMQTSFKNYIDNKKQIVYKTYSVTPT